MVASVIPDPTVPQPCDVQAAAPGLGSAIRPDRQLPPGQRQ